jgi:hypothetical protein
MLLLEPIEQLQTVKSAARSQELKALGRTSSANGTRVDWRKYEKQFVALKVQTCFAPWTGARPNDAFEIAASIWINSQSAGKRRAARADQYLLPRTYTRP